MEGVVLQIFYNAYSEDPDKSDSLKKVWWAYVHSRMSCRSVCLCFFFRYWLFGRARTTSANQWSEGSRLFWLFPQANWSVACVCSHFGCVVSPWILISLQLNLQLSFFFFFLTSLHPLGLPRLLHRHHSSNSSSSSSNSNSSSSNSNFNSSNSSSSSSNNNNNNNSNNSSNSFSSNNFSNSSSSRYNSSSSFSNINYNSSNPPKCSPPLFPPPPKVC